MAQRHPYDALQWFINELGARVVAKSGIPSDMYHVGKLTLQSFKDAPDFLMQIDGATGESDTFQTAMERSIKCATAFRNLGLKTHDIVVLMAPNNIDLTIPMYSCFYLGVGAAGVDPTLGVNELADTFKICLPKIIFCQSVKVAEVQLALKDINLDVRIVTFDKEEKCDCFSEFLEKYASNNTSIKDFQVTDFDPEETIGLLVSTSGTTGLPKCAALTHKNIMFSLSYFWLMLTEYPTPTKLALILSPVQWLSALIHFVGSPILRYTRLQTSDKTTTSHTYFLINKYKPTLMVLSPTMMITLIKPGGRDQCDFTCFEHIFLGGSAVQQVLVDELKKLIPRTDIYVGYGLSEIGGVALSPAFPFRGSCGRPLGHLKYRLVDVETGRDIEEPNVQGELWLKGPSAFKGYYNNPKMTDQIFAEDKWLKTGDIFYRDENWNFFFVDRLKLLLKYRNHQISPVEIESVILKHPAVLDVAVTGIPDAECGDLPVACVVPVEAKKITAEQINCLVKESLTDSKQLRGGVVFLPELPQTSTAKVNRTALKKMVMNMKRETGRSVL